MSRRRRSPSQPEYIHLQPYRALVGVPMKTSRPGFASALVVGCVKGALFGLILVVIALVALGYREGGFSHIGEFATQQLQWACLALIACAIGGGALRLARR